MVLQYASGVKVKVSQLCPTLCDPMDYTVHGIVQARILEWLAFPFSRGSSKPRDQTQVSHIAGGFFTSLTKSEAQEIWRRWLIRRRGVNSCLLPVRTVPSILYHGLWKTCCHSNQVFSQICWEPRPLSISRHSIPFFQLHSFGKFWYESTLTLFCIIIDTELERVVRNIHFQLPNKEHSKALAYKGLFSND